MDQPYMHFPLITEKEALLPFLIRGIGTQPDQERIVRPSGLPEFQWTLCVKGSGLFLIDGKEFHIEAGTGFYFINNLPHEYYSTSAPWETKWILFSGSALLGLFHQLDLGNYGCFQLEDFGLDHPILKKHQDLYEALLQADPGQLVDFSAIAMEFLLLMKHKNMTPNQQKEADTSNLGPILDYMKGHYREDLSLLDLAQRMDISEEHFCRLFKKSLGLTPIQYLMRLRIQAAKNLLLTESDCPIYEIAHAVGYEDVSYFGALFKKMEDTTPSAFRRLHSRTT